MNKHMKSSFPPILSRFVLATTVCAAISTTAFAQAPAAPGAPAAPAKPATAAPPPGATPPAATPAEKPKPLSSTDQLFVRNAAKSLNYQIQLAAAAKTAITDPNLGRVRDTISSDLTKALAAITKIAEAHGEKLSTEVAGTEKFDLDRLGKTKPDKFTKEWVELLLKESKRLDRDTEAIGKTGQDPELKTFSTNYGPSIRSVYSSADTAEKALKKTK